MTGQQVAVTEHGRGGRGSTAHTVRQTLQQRGAEATRSLRQVLQLPTNVNDTTVLDTALAEAAVQESRQNPAFAEAIRRYYDELTAAQGATTRRTRQPSTSPALSPAKPIRTDLGWRPIDPFAPPDPDWLTQVYGRDQLPRVLQDFSVDSLKQAAAVLESTFPGTKPVNRGQRAALIAYIVEYSGKA